MKKLIFLGLITVISIFFYGCCGGFGASGIDCTNYNASTTIFIKMNMDSSNLGFKIMELDSTYLIKYKSSKTNLFDKVIDTTYFYNEKNIRFIDSNYLKNSEIGIQIYDESQEGKSLSDYSYKVINSNSQIINDITLIQIEALNHENKCCTDKYRTSPNITGYKLNGVQKTDKIIVINKK
jgi:hypothetical protein